MASGRARNSPEPRTPPTVVHVIGGLDPGGVERWLLSLFAATAGRARHVVLALAPAPGTLEDTAARLGVGLVRCPLRRSPGFARRFSQAIRRVSPRVVHSHVHHASGLLLWVARRCGIPIRVAHSHTTRDGFPDTVTRRAYRGLSERLIRRHATAGVAVAHEAAAALFGRRWGDDSRFRIIPYGIDLAPFAGEPPREEVRRQLRLPLDAPVIGQVGRFHPVKNHSFTLRVAAALARREPRARFVFVGDGPSRRECERQAEEKGIQARCLFLGRVDDGVARLLAGLDLLVHPSFFEGLPVALLEAQAAGVPVLASASITREVAVVPGLVRFADLAAGPERWAAEAAQIMGGARPSRADAHARLEHTDFDIRRSARRFLELYGAC